MYAKDGGLLDRREMLRVKAKSLAEEARIIRREESRTAKRCGSSGELVSELRQHRREVVRYEARATYMAYGLVRGRQVDRIERPKSPRSEEFWKKVRTMIERYGPLEADRRKMLLTQCREL